MASNEALIRRWFAEVWNQNRLAAVDELAAPDAVVHGLSEDGRPRVGPAHFLDFIRSFRSALGDIRVTVEDVLSDGDRTAARLTLRATHTGDGFGFPASGRPVVATAIVIARWRDGRIVEGWNEFDAAGMLRQINAPAVPTTLRA
jgi:steroid delta-isomerase-like uncharacterized protein